MIAVGEEGSQQVEPLCVREVRLGISPLGLKDLDEGLGFAVGLGAIGAGEDSSERQVALSRTL